MSRIQVDNLMVELEAQAAGRSEPDFPQQSLQEGLPELRDRQRVEPRPLLIGRTAYERLWVRINTLLRRAAAHAVEPVVIQQNEWNGAAGDAIERLIEADAAIRDALLAVRAARSDDKVTG